MLTVAFQDGFDHYPASFSASQVLGISNVWNVSVISGGTNLTFETGFRGRGKCVSGVDGAFTQSLIRPVPQCNQMSLHVAVLPTDWNTDLSRAFLSWRDGSAAQQFSLQFRPNNRLGLFRGSTLLGETQPMSESVVYRLNIAADFTTPGNDTFQMWVNGDLNAGMNLSGIDLLNTSENFVEAAVISWTGHGSNVEPYGFQVDDYVFCYGAAENIGELEIVTDGPTADVLKEWTPSTGTDNYAMVDELPPDAETSYNSSDTVGNRDLQSFPALPTDPDTIFCLSQIFAARKEEAGTRGFSAVLNQTAATVGAQQNLSTDYNYYYEHYLENPETVAAWLASERAAASFGYEDAL